jgi:short-subunit dehydrogenase
MPVLVQEQSQCLADNLLASGSQRLRGERNNMSPTINRSLAVVTGASSGIGLELAKEFARNGFDLVVIAENNRILTAAEELREWGANVRAIQQDLACYEGVENACSQISEVGRPVDALALNAGVGAGGDFVRETTLEKDLNVIDLNIRSTVHMAKRLLPEMVRRGKGRVLFTSSIAATMPGALNSVYNGSKAFIQSFAQAIRQELENTGVTVTALMPGPTETDFFRRADMEDTKVGQSEKDDPAEVAHEGFEALMAGKDHVIAGSFKNTVQATMAHVLPDTVLASMHEKQGQRETPQ